METRTDAASKQKVWDLIKDIQVAMLASDDGGGTMRARSMVAQQQSFDGELWFFSWANSPKMDEIRRNQRVLLTYADPSNQNYVSINGTADVVRDRNKIRELWSEGLRTWFPKGSDDPNIALIRVEVDAAEYWDSPSSTMVHAYGYIKAQLTGEPPNPGENKRVQF